MSFQDLDQELAQLGYGNQWSKTVYESARRRQVWSETTAKSDIDRLQKWHKQNPEAYSAARNRWTKKRSEEVRHRIGKQNCVKCGSLMKMTDLIGENRLPGHCGKCRKANCE